MIGATTQSCLTQLSEGEGVGSRKWCSVAWWEVVRNTALVAGAARGGGGQSGSNLQIQTRPTTGGPDSHLGFEKTSGQGGNSLCLGALYSELCQVPGVSPLQQPTEPVQWHKSNIAPGRYGAIIKWPALGDRSHCCEAAVFLSSRDKSSLWRFLFRDPTQTGTGAVRIFDFYVTMRQLFKQNIYRWIDNREVIGK